MPKKYRLSGLEIRNLAGKRMHGRFFSVLIASLGGDHAKCAIVVSKKVSAKAVDRNKIQRRFRNIVAKRMSKVHKPVALVLYTKREAKNATFTEIEKDIDELFSKL